MAHVDINVTAGREQVNLKKANIDGDFGWIQLELEGSIEEIQRATAWLMTTGLTVEALQRAVGA